LGWSVKKSGNGAVTAMRHWSWSDRPSSVSRSRRDERSISRPRQQKSRPVTGGFLVYQSEEAQASSAGASSASTAISPGSAFGS
jgi:hypothetical protein